MAWRYLCFLIDFFKFIKLSVKKVNFNFNSLWLIIEMFQKELEHFSDIGVNSENVVDVLMPVFRVLRRKIREWCCSAILLRHLKNLLLASSQHPTKFIFVDTGIPDFSLSDNWHTPSSKTCKEGVFTSKN